MDDQPLVIHRRQRNCETQQIAMDRVNAERRKAAELRRQEREQVRQQKKDKQAKCEDVAAFKINAESEEVITAAWKILDMSSTTMYTAVIGTAGMPSTWVTSGSTTTSPFPSSALAPFTDWAKNEYTTTGTLTGYYNPDSESQYAIGENWSMTINGEQAEYDLLTNAYKAPGHWYSSEFVMEHGKAEIDPEAKTITWTIKKP